MRCSVHLLLRLCICFDKLAKNPAYHIARNIDVYSITPSLLHQFEVQLAVTFGEPDFGVPSRNEIAQSHDNSEQNKRPDRTTDQTGKPCLSRHK